MSDVRVTLSTALTAVVSNSWLDELPADPTFPALVFTVDSTPEEQWCQGGGYDQHTVTVALLATDADWITTIKPSVVAAMEAVPGFMFEDSSGDGEYEDDPNVFAFFILFRVRTPRF